MAFCRSVWAWPVQLLFSRRNHSAGMNFYGPQERLSLLQKNCVVDHPDFASQKLIENKNCHVPGRYHGLDCHDSNKKLSVPSLSSLSLQKHNPFLQPERVYFSLRYKETLEWIHAQTAETCHIWEMLCQYDWSVPLSAVSGGRRQHG